MGELPALLTVLATRLGAIDRVTYHLDEWVLHRTNSCSRARQCVSTGTGTAPCTRSKCSAISARERVSPTGRTDALRRWRLELGARHTEMH
ncbi:hypothetical protein [Nocardia terpenica]|uniref:hypothetical protein n=1 Tax=Nocardia terpenica TaxID=455432 RepID=UPI001E3E94E9|nr:hypothetical protein [Nocardia terpenica]